MSTITFSCHSCSKVLKVGADKGGKKAKCSQCGTILTIPMTSEEPADELVDEPDDEAAPPRKARGRNGDEAFEQPPPRRRPRGDADDLAADRGPEAGRDRGKAKPAPIPIFAFVGIGLLAILAVTVFLPWRTANIAGLKLTGNGIQTLGGKITLGVGILGVAFVLVAMLALGRGVFKASLWTAFGLSILGLLFGTLAALVSTTHVQGGGVTEGGAWGAWVAMLVALAACVMFLLAALSVKSQPGPSRRPSDDDEMEEEERPPPRIRRPRRDDDE